MSRHLKNIVMDGLKNTCATFVQLPPDSTPHTKGVRYFRVCTGIQCLWGAMDSEKEGRKRRKRIVVRPSRFRSGLFELYTYHFPKHWSAACVANRELIKEAQRQAHALEHAHTREALEWRLRFWHHYFTVCKGGAKPEPGLKPYTRFYQYTYVAIYRQLQNARQEAAKKAEELLPDLSFEPILPRPVQLPAVRRSAAHHVFLTTEEAHPLPPPIPASPSAIE